MTKGISIAAIAFVVACAAPRRDNGGADDDDGPGPDASPNVECAEGNELIYTIDQGSARLSRFDPTTKTFMDLGNLACPTSSPATPFSMSVDRGANAWVLYNNGDLFKVGIGALASCARLAWTAPAGLKVFGMGFSTDTAQGSAESLFIGGGMTQTQASFTLARVDPATMVTTTIGTQTVLPEMTGNANAELWGFMPEPTTARVVQFDKASGGALQTFTLPSLGGTNTAYAFAHWGGDYWVFLQKNLETNTTVYQIDGATGSIVSMTAAPGRTIVGAGVSTCAPTVIL